MNIEDDGYESTLTDIFSGKEIFKKTAIYKIAEVEYIYDNNCSKGQYAFLFPIHKYDRNILLYADKKVPLYILQQLYYNINNVDVKKYALKMDNNFKQ